MCKTMPSEKRVSDGICVPCVRLRFVLTKLIVPTVCWNVQNNAVWKRASDGLCVACVGLRFAEMCKTKQCRLKHSDGLDKIIESAQKHQLCTLMPAVIWFWLVLFKNEEAKSLQQPQQVATPNWACKSPSVLAPAATVSWIWRSVIALQMQTNIMCSFCSRIGMRVNIICLCEYKCKPFLLQALKM